MTAEDITTARRVRSEGATAAALQPAPPLPHLVLGTSSEADFTLLDEEDLSELYHEYVELYGGY